MDRRKLYRSVLKVVVQKDELNSNKVETVTFSTDLVVGYIEDRNEGVDPDQPSHSKSSKFLEASLRAGTVPLSIGNSKPVKNWPLSPRLNQLGREKHDIKLTTAKS